MGSYRGEGQEAVVVEILVEGEVMGGVWEGVGEVWEEEEEVWEEVEEAWQGRATRLQNHTWLNSWGLPLIL